MQYAGYVFFLLVLNSSMNAQQLRGEYRLRGVQDAASAFTFTPEGRFEFFFMYGAVDRFAEGTYTIENDTIKLKSSKEPGNDFPVTFQSRKGRTYRIKVNDPNPYLASSVMCLYFTEGVEQVAYPDDEGLIEIPYAKVDQIYLIHQLYPDIASMIKDTGNTNNNFEVSLSPDLAQVSFKGIDFFLEGKSITCHPNYFLPFEQIRFTKD